FVEGASGIADLLRSAGQLLFQRGQASVQLILLAELGQGLREKLLHLQLLVFRQLALGQCRQRGFDGFPGGGLSGQERRGGQAQQEQEQRANQRHDNETGRRRERPGRPTRFGRGGLGLEERSEERRVGKECKSCKAVLYLNNEIILLVFGVTNFLYNMTRVIRLLT